MCAHEYKRGARSECKLGHKRIVGKAPDVQFRNVALGRLRVLIARVLALIVFWRQKAHYHGGRFEARNAIGA